MKKIYIFTAVLALLTLSLNAQFQAKKNVAQTQQTAPTGKKVDRQLGLAKMALNPTGYRAPARATETTTVTFLPEYSSSTVRTKTVDGVTLTITGGDLGYSDAMRLQGTVTLSAAEGTITQIVFTGSSTSYPVTLLSTSTGNYTTSNNVGTWTGNAANVSFTASNQVRCSRIVVTVETETGGGEGTDDLTICDGGYFIEYLPVWGYWYDAAQHNQMIYPASMLTNLVGKNITSMTFYPTGGYVDSNDNGQYDSGETTYQGLNFYGGSVTFKLMNLSSGTSPYTDENASLITGTMTAVKTLIPQNNANATTWVISFDQNFKYTGGDLLIDMTSTAGTYGRTAFSCDVLDSNQSALTLTTSSGDIDAGLPILPMVTFTYELEGDPIHDLAIALAAQPATVGAGGDVTLTATVTNNGDFAENGYTVTFTANGSTINTQTATSELPVGQSTTFTYTYTTTDAQAGTTVNFGANVTCTDDADASNNEATASTSVLTCPPPENVAATATGNTGTMTWDAPTIGMVPGTLIWDFEEQTDFNAFTYIDSDGDGYNWYWHENTGSGNYTTNSGNGVMASESYNNDTQTALSPDNWLISPQIALGGTLTFYAAHQATYPENFAVYVCVGSYNGVSNFVKISPDVTTNANMTQYTYDLSQYSGQGYFAIRHYNSSDNFILLIDDIECQTTVPGEQPISYNVYLDGEFVGNVNANTFSYDFSDVSVGEHTCAVSAVYSYGESAAVPATFTIQHPAELTAPANGSTVDVGTNTGSGTSTTVTVSGSYLTQALSVSVSGDGFSVSPTIISAADANAGTTITVTYNGTNPDASGTLTISSGEVSTTVILSATYSESEPAFSTNGIIRMGNLIIVDQFWASTAENTHPEQYSYILRYTPAQGDPKESSPKTVDVEHVKSVVNGYYTEEDVKNDSITYNTVIVNKMTADVEMTLPNNDNKIYYVRLQGKDNDVPSEADKVNDNSDMIVKLQMTSGDGGFYYIDQIPTSHPQYTPGQVNHFMDPAEPGTGSSYGDFKTYVPSVMTYGQSRRYFANDTLHNTYGAPVWRTGIGDVTIQNGMKVERQSNQWGSTQWEANGQACSLYILDNILAYGKLPNKQNSNVDYEPYMFRVFVESPSGKLRGYTPQNVYSPEKPDSIIGTELVADNSFTNFTGPICIYSEYFDGASHIDMVADATNGDYFKFTLNKNSDNWVDNAMFGGLDDIIQGEGDDLSLSDQDLKVYVRFYYRSKGSINPSHVIRGRDGSLPHMYYGAEAESPTPDPWTSVTEVRSHGEIIGVTYVNAQGMTSNKPFDGLNIVVTRYSDGSTTTTKVVR